MFHIKITDELCEIFLVAFYGIPFHFLWNFFDEKRFFYFIPSVYLNMDFCDIVYDCCNSEKRVVWSIKFI